ncbi:MAG: hypothetical protein AAFN74_26575, partial [Myxococcota bacterium]
LVNVWFGGPCGVHRAVFEAALAAGAPVGGPGLVVWGLGQPFERYAPPAEVALEHARQCVFRAHVLALQWGVPGADSAQIVYEAQRIGRPFRSIDLAIVNQLNPVVEDVVAWLRSTRPHLYVVGGEQASPQSHFYQRTVTLVSEVLDRFPRPRTE